MTTEEKAKAYDNALKRAKAMIKVANNQEGTYNSVITIFPELKESEGEKIKKALKKILNEIVTDTNYKELGIDYSIRDMIAWLDKQGDKSTALPKWKYKNDNTPLLRDSIILNKYGCVAKSPSGAIINDAWVLDYSELAKLPKEELEKQGEIDKESYEIAEKEKYDFVSGQFIECRKSFDVFKEDNSYWLEYVGNDNYIGRSDNILNQKFHITPRQLYSSFTQEHCPKEDDTNAPMAYGKYVDECLNEASEHFFSEGEDKYSVADLFHAGVRCGKSWFEKQGEQKPTSDTKYEVKAGGSLSVSASDYKYATITQKDFASKEETKFNVGDWVVTDKNDRVQIKAVNNSYYTIDNGMYFNIPYVDRCWHLWAVQDAIDGDVLSNGDMILIFKEFEEPAYRQHIIAYIGLDSCGHIQVTVEHWELGVDKAKPATKEQRDLLFQKMEEAGYEWDAEKKELKKIEDEEYNGEDYGIDGLWHAQRILEKTLGSVDGYQSDDGILEHKAAITAVKKLYEQKPSWSYEDEANLNNIIWLCNNCINGSEATWIPSQAKKIKHLIETVKERGLSQQKPTEWSDEDERNLNGIIDEIIANRNEGSIYDIKTYNRFLGWLKSLKDRATWKPSDEQMENFKELVDDNNQRSFYPTLKSLYNDLKKL